MGSALLNTGLLNTDLADKGAAQPDHVSSFARKSVPVPSPSEDALRTQVAERLAAHRLRRGAARLAASDQDSSSQRTGNARSARIAATVAARYAQTPSYRAFLAAEAEKAIEQARAAAEVAALNAQAVAAAQQHLLDAFDAGTVPPGAPNLASEMWDSAGEDQAAPTFWPDLAAAPARSPRPAPSTAKKHVPSPPATSGLVAQPAAEGVLTVRLYKDAAGERSSEIFSGAARPWSAAGYAARVAARRNATPASDDEALALDEEIAFRQAPVFEEPAGPALPLPANLLEFPRQLVASRKARPRYAEGPLRDEAEAAALDGQLRIFEVDPAQISTEPVAEAASSPVAQWTSIWLDAPAKQEAAPAFDSALPHHEAGTAAEQLRRESPTLYPAAYSKRFAAASLDAGVISVALAAFGAAFAAVGHRLGAIQTSAVDPGAASHGLARLGAAFAAWTGFAPAQAAAIAVVAGIFLVLAYFAMFFWFSVATPGMRVARVAFCTFEDGNPTRRAIRLRALAMLMSAAPFGLGFAWAAIDDDGMAWHDRLTRTYLRSY